MEHNELKQLIHKWENMTDSVLDLERIQSSKLQALLKETYTVLCLYHKNEFVPKEISKVFLEIEEFLYFASVLGEKEFDSDYYCYRKVFTVIKALERGFFCGDYGLDFPKLRVVDDGNNVFVFDFETNLLSDIPDRSLS